MPWSGPVGADVGAVVGPAVGALVGATVGAAVGAVVGATAVGCAAVGALVGTAVGAAVGSAVGSAVGFGVGGGVGSDAGTTANSVVTIGSPTNTSPFDLPLPLLPAVAFPLSGLASAATGTAAPTSYLPSLTLGTLKRTLNAPLPLTVTSGMSVVAASKVSWSCCCPSKPWPEAVTVWPGRPSEGLSVSFGPAAEVEVNGNAAATRTMTIPTVATQSLVRDGGCGGALISDGSVVQRVPSQNCVGIGDPP